jgi:hypothetical protein
MYALDTQAAKEADQTSQYLRDTGKYIGVFIRAEKIISSNKGTHGVGFTFGTGTVAQPGQTTRFDLWTMSKDGEHLMGFKSLMAIMTCLKLRDIKPVAGKVERYFYETKTSHVEDAEVFPELVGKPIGCLFRNTEYRKMKDGKQTNLTGWRLELAGAFQADTELTAGEILDKKTSPMQLAKMVEQLADRPLKSGGSTPAGAAQNRGPVDQDDDIPF